MGKLEWLYCTMSVCLVNIIMTYDQLLSPSPTGKFHQYQIVGRTLPTESDEHPKIYHMKLWATNEVRAKSKFWVFSVEAEEGQEEQWAKACYY
ncbi:hypothetical protein SO802_010766 [Lithocarpus litseifolius]|uniref:Ribosomal protein 50S-L18Ae/60S-L20/60S-L18A domain-containing protein n=1 Tax=Lithocarpus litseifolius TaxID=425828 RepID=A0AAW2DI65_9ROSI